MDRIPLTIRLNIPIDRIHDIVDIVTSSKSDQSIAKDAPYPYEDIPYCESQVPFEVYEREAEQYYSENNKS